MPLPIIKDIAIIGDLDRPNPCGEAPRSGEPHKRMTADERHDMMERLFQSIDSLMDKAHTNHLENNHVPDSETVNPDYVTRLSTNEFFFYTKEPLTIQEFEALHDKIAKKAEQLPPGIQFVLGSFAVKTADNRVMNVTPHISSGQPPSFQFIVKNHTSPIDVRYKEEDASGAPSALEPFDITTRPPSDWPQILVNGRPLPFTFDNVVLCQTPGGTPIYTAVDICADHLAAVGKLNIQERLKRELTLANHSISHMVVSNYVRLNAENCLGTTMHVDPAESRVHCKQGISQATEGTARAPSTFGQDSFTILHVHPTACQTLQEASPRMVEQVLTEKKLIETLEGLKFGPYDKPMNQFIEGKRHAFTWARTFEAKEAVLNELRSMIQALSADQATQQIRDIIAKFREKQGAFSVGMEKKAYMIEDAMSKVPLQDRCHLYQSDATRDVMVALAAHRRLGGDPYLVVTPSGEIDEKKAANSYKNFKERYRAQQQKQAQPTEPEEPTKRNASGKQPKL